MKDKIMPRMTDVDRINDIIEYLSSIKVSSILQLSYFQEVALCVELLEHTNSRTARGYLNNVLTRSHSIQRGSSAVQQVLRSHFEG